MLAWATSRDPVLGKKKEKSCKILSRLNLFFLLNLCSQTYKHTGYAEHKSSALRGSLFMLLVAHRSCVPHRTLLVPPVAWLGLVLSLSLYCYGLCKPDHLVHWGGEFVGGVG